MSDRPITVFTSAFCFHSQAVERYLKRRSIPAEYISIDGNPAARARVMELNRGYASVPTLVFPDGSQLTEPSFGQLRRKLGIQEPGLFARLKKLFGGG